SLCARPHSPAACYHPAMARVAVAAIAVAAIAGAAIAAAPLAPQADRDADAWARQTRSTMTLDEKVGQLIVPAFESNFISTDSDAFEELTRLVRGYHVGGFHVFGASIPAPSVLLNPGYGTVVL